MAATAELTEGERIRMGPRPQIPNYGEFPVTADLLL